jgi:hypothetical protein
MLEYQMAVGKSRRLRIEVRTVPVVPAFGVLQDEAAARRSSHTHGACGQHSWSRHRHFGRGGDAASQSLEIPNIIVAGLLYFGIPAANIGAVIGLFGSRTVRCKPGSSCNR